jgi:hypothetical protein
MQQDAQLQYYEIIYVIVFYGDNKFNQNELEYQLNMS